MSQKKVCLDKNMLRRLFKYSPKSFPSRTYLGESCLEYADARDAVRGGGFLWPSLSSLSVSSSVNLPFLPLVLAETPL